MKTVRDILKEYFEVMDVPSDEDGLVAFITKEFNTERFNLEDMDKKNNMVMHPGSHEIKEALKYINKVLLAQNDNIALVNAICDLEDELLDTKDDMINVKNFYQSQIKLYDNALKLKHDVMDYEKDYLYEIPAIKDAIERINDITKISNNFKYNRIPELNDCISTIQDERNKVIDAKKAECNDLVDSCLNEVHLKADNEEKLKAELNNAIHQFDSRKQEISRLNSLVQLDAKQNTITALKDNIIDKMDRILNTDEDIHVDPVQPVKPVKAKKVRQVQRAVVFNQANLSSKEDFDRYVQNIKNKLLSYLNDDDEIQIK